MNKEQTITLLEAIDIIKANMKGGHPDFIDMTLDEIELHNAKNSDYAKGGNPLGNFYRVSESLTAMGFQISPPMVAIVYSWKQVDAAIHMMNEGYEGAIENVDTRLRDAHVYLKLARILYKETQQAKNEALVS